MWSVYWVTVSIMTSTENASKYVVKLPKQNHCSISMKTSFGWGRTTFDDILNNRNLYT